MAIGRAPWIIRPAQLRLSSEETARRLELDFDGIVAGLGSQEQRKMAKKRRKLQQ
jgi:hypothetical protein